MSSYIKQFFVSNIFSRRSSYFFEMFYFTDKADTVYNDTAMYPRVPLAAWLEARGTWSRRVYGPMPNSARFAPSYLYLSVGKAVAANSKERQGPRTQPFGVQVIRKQSKQTQLCQGHGIKTVWSTDTMEIGTREFCDRDDVLVNNWTSRFVQFRWYCFLKNNNYISIKLIGLFTFQIFESLYFF